MDSFYLDSFFNEEAMSLSEVLISLWKTGSLISTPENSIGLIVTLLTIFLLKSCSAVRL